MFLLLVQSSDLRGADFPETTQDLPGKIVFCPGEDRGVTGTRSNGIPDHPLAGETAGCDISGSESAESGFPDGFHDSPGSLYRFHISSSVLFLFLFPAYCLNAELKCELNIVQ